MEGFCSKNEEACPQLLDLIPRNANELQIKRDGRDDDASVEKKLELRLGPPGEQEAEAENHWSINGGKEKVKEDKSLLSFGYFTNGIPQQKMQNRFIACNNENLAVWFNQQQQAKASFLQSCLPVMAKESSQPCSSKAAVDLQLQQQQQQQQQAVAEKKAFLRPPSPANTAVTNSSQKRTAPGPVVGWPPIRSFRKNLASSSNNSTKPSGVESQNGNPNKKAAAGEEKPLESCKKGLFVKINMDGVPIGRKVDLKAYDSYEKLSSAVDKLFRGLLAAQRDSSAGGIVNNQEEIAITGVLDGSGEYTLVYEDNEGDRMLVGDVPWHMFVSTVKRLRVLKSSEVSTMNFGSSKQSEGAI